AFRASSYRDSKSMHLALVISALVVSFILLSLYLIGVFARLPLTGIVIADEVISLIVLVVLPGWISDIVLAARFAAMISTIDSLLLLISSSVVKDIYVNYIKPEATMNHVKKVSLSVTVVIGIVAFLMALNPPELLIYLNLFAFGGLEAAFVWPLVLGLYWR